MVLSWIKNYLQNRKQRVCIQGSSSDWRMINCGVPWGSVLGPLFFLIYINNIVQVVNNCQIRLFADDTCLFYNYSDPNLVEFRVNSDIYTMGPLLGKLNSMY